MLGSVLLLLSPLSIISVVAPGSSSASSASFDPYAKLSAQFREHDLKMSANFEKIEHRVQNDLQYICSSIQYLQTCVDETYSRNAWPVPHPRGHAPVSYTHLTLPTIYSV